MSEGKHALVFGASGVVGWGVVEQLLDNYPAKGSFATVTALVNRPLDLADTQWPQPSSAGPEFRLVSGANLSDGSVEDFADWLGRNVAGVDKITHVFYLGIYAIRDTVGIWRAHGLMHTRSFQPVRRPGRGKEEEPGDDEESSGCRGQAVPQSRVRRVSRWRKGTIRVIQIDQSRIVFADKRAKAYGIGLPEKPFTAPYRESVGRMTGEAGKTVFYYDLEDYLIEASAGKKWTWTEVMPDAVVGFVPNGSYFNLTSHWANYLSTYALIEGEGAEVPYPGSSAGYTSTYNEASSAIIGKFIIWAGLNIDKVGRGQVYNIADQAKPESMAERWPAICSYFGLKGVGPTEDANALAPSEYVKRHQAVLKERGVKSNEVFKANFLDSYGYYLYFNREFSLDKARSVGFKEELNPNESWFKAFDRFKKAGVILS